MVKGIALADGATKVNMTCVIQDVTISFSKNDMNKALSLIKKDFDEEAT